MRNGRWDLDFVEKFGLLRDKSPLKKEGEEVRPEPGVLKKCHWDADSEGLSDADSSTSKEEMHTQLQLQLPPPGLPSPPWMTKESPLIPHPTCKFGPPPLSMELFKALSEEILLFTSWAELRPCEQQERTLVQQQFEDLVKSLWPSSKVELFGSTAFGLALPSSDLDLVISGVEDFRPSYPLPHLITLSQHLQATGIRAEIIANAKVPLVKYCHPRAQVWVDVTFTALNSTRCIPVVKQYLQQYPLIKPMVVVIKTLLRQHGLHKPHDGGLGSYAVVLLLCCFLRLRAYAKVIDVQNHASVGMLMVDFLRYFAGHGTDNAYTPGGSEPIDVSRDTRGHLEIWDPMDRSNNVAYSCRRVEHIQTIFGMAVDSLAWYSPRHCASVMGSFICVFDPNFRMPLVSRLKEGVLGDGQLPSAEESDGETPSSEGGATTSPTTSPREAGSDAPGTAKSLLEVRRGAVLGCDLESELLMELEQQGAKELPKVQPE
eukprot:GGOE01005835.1.p1 GENE.GGOE01005835.1~~GGOE01005835.1.p1  ORF type:complete len:531 (-),score=85.23 GGOE01005835.1:1556-3016(-)